jgi:monoamine oxidase
MDPNLCGRIQYSPPLPYMRDQLTQKMSAGYVNKIHIVYKSNFWSKNGYSGEIISDVGPISICYDKSYGEFYCIVGFIAAKDGR